MNIKKFMRGVAVSLAFLGVASGTFAQQSQQQGGDVLTGDAGTACQVILCLSSGKRPPECNPPLQRYYSISYKFWSDTVKARRDFLKLCPAANDTSSANMPALVDAMVNGAGRCDAASLNQILKPVEVQKCDGYGEFQECYTQTVWVVDSTEPSYCVDYTTNVNTYMLGVTYVGDPMQGGHWVDASTGQ